MTEIDNNTKNMEVEPEKQFDLKKMLSVFFLSFGCCLIAGVVLYGLWYVISGASDGFDRYMEKGNACYETEDYVKAQTYYMKALGEDESSVDARVALANTYEKLEKYEEIVALMERGIELSPATYEYYAATVKAYVYLDKIDQARDFMEGITNSYVLLKLQRNQPDPITFSKEPGTYDAPISINLAAPVGATIYFTTDGSTPSLSSQTYSDPIALELGTMHLRCFALGSSGIISSEYDANYVVRDKDAAYTFVDEAIGKAVRSTLQVGSNSAVTYGQLDKIETLVCENRGIKSLEDLKELLNLTSLSLVKEQGISDFSIICELTGLNALSLEDCAISDEQVAQLKDATNLTNLYLNKNQISDVSSLATLVRLKELSLANNKLTTLTGLEPLIRLTTLNLEGNKMTDLASIAKLTNLQSLNLASNDLTEIGALSALTNLKTLYLYTNKLTNLMGISGMKSLSQLSLNQNQLTDISSLAGMTSLSSLDLSENPTLSDYTPLTQTTLSTLVAQANGITDLSVICQISTLRELNVSYNAITSVEDIVKLPTLTTLYISYNSVSKLAPLKGCATLTGVHYAGNPVTDLDKVSGGLIALIDD